MFRKMTIKKLLKGEQVNVLQVNVLREISSTKFIVGDVTGLAIMYIEENTQKKQTEVGKGLKLMKPQKLGDHMIGCHDKFKPMKTKAATLKVNEKKIDELEAMDIHLNPISQGTPFQEIVDNYGQNANIDDVLAYVTTVSRMIDGKYGMYQICNIKDCHGTTLTINLYKENTGKLNPNTVYRIKNIKKTTIQTNSTLRLGTTTLTTIREAKEEETKLFANTMIADKKIDAECAMFNEFSYYKSCRQHNAKLTENGQCKVCGQVEKDDGKLDFRATLLLVTADGSIVPITVFRRLLDIEIQEDDTEEIVCEKVENHIVGKRCQIDYNENGDDDNIAVKIEIL